MNVVVIRGLLVMIFILDTLAVVLIHWYEASRGDGDDVALLIMVITSIDHLTPERS